ncbi:MAG: hypothetical protein WA383_02330 [Terriglobales bacterium]
MMMHACENCGDEVKRRIRCQNCGLLICSWCYNHVHAVVTLRSEIEHSNVEPRNRGSGGTMPHGNVKWLGSIRQVSKGTGFLVTAD